MEGHIAFKESGDNGFGYDSLFIPLGYNKSFGNFTSEDKNKISHRAKALVKLRKLLMEKDNDFVKSQPGDKVCK